MRLSAGIVGAAVLAVGLVACGDGGSGDPPTARPAGTGAETSASKSSTSATHGSDAATQRSEAMGASKISPEKHSDSGGGAEQFIVKGGDNSVQSFGEEAGASEREEAAEALHGFLDARAAEDWARACTYLAAQTRQMLLDASVKSELLKGEDCGGIVEAFYKGFGPRLRLEADAADVGSLRFEDDRGFLLYRGYENKVYAVPVSEEDGRWKLGTISLTAIN